MKIAPEKLLEALQAHIGTGNGVKIGDLVAEIVEGNSSPSLEREAREIVAALRNAGHPIGAHPTYGYYWANSTEELEFTLRFLRSRALSSLTQIQKLKKVAMPDLAGQIRLPIGTEPGIPQQISVFDFLAAQARCPQSIPLDVEIPDQLWDECQRFLEENPQWDRNLLLSEALSIFLLAQEKAEVKEK